MNPLHETIEGDPPLGLDKEKWGAPYGPPPQILVDRIPAPIWDGLVRYVEHHIRPGGFLSSVIANDLSLALQRGEPGSLATLGYLHRIVLYHLPSGCWGSWERLEEWVKGR